MALTSRRAAVLDVGCFSAQLLMVEQSLSRQVSSYKVRLRLDKAVDETGRITSQGVDEISAAVATAGRHLWAAPDADFLAFATSSVRDAANADEVVEAVARRTGLTLRLIPGTKEADLAYQAAREWTGAAGPLTMLDIGGGTFEVAHGDGPRPGFACSLPFGTRGLADARLIRNLGEVRTSLRKRVEKAIPADVRAAMATSPAVGCSKVFQSLAKLTGKARLRVDDVTGWIPRLAAMSPRKRAQLPGISRHRAGQALAGAVLAEALMTATGHHVIDISPWSTREGVLLHLLEREPA